MICRKLSIRSPLILASLILLNIFGQRGAHIGLINKQCNKRNKWNFTGLQGISNG
jgi:hypothetical protein